MGLPSLALTVAPGEETSGTACFQHASPHYHSHPSGALQTMALNIHGNPLSSLFIPHQHFLIYANRVPLLKVLNRGKSTKPYSRAHYSCHLFLSTSCPDFQLVHLTNRTAFLHQKTTTVTMGNAYVHPVNILLSHIRSLPLLILARHPAPLSNLKQSALQRLQFPVNPE